MLSLKDNDQFAQIIETAVNRARKTAGKDIDINYIFPEDKYCFLLSPKIAELLGGKDLEMERPAYAEGRIRHTFFILKQKGKSQSYLLDPSYLQFVNEEDRKGLPDILLYPITTKSKMTRILLNHKIHKKDHKIWLSKIF